MDFNVSADPPQVVEFRKEVAGWLAEQFKGHEHLRWSASWSTREDEAEYKFRRSLAEKLGAKGWLFPIYPKKYGGAELTVDHQVVIETELDPAALLARLQALEDSLGRVRRGGTPEAQRFEPRTVDIDILLYGDRVISGPEHLHIPHLLMHERRFVLRPLADLAPDLEHPVLYQTIRELLDTLEDEHEVLVSDLPRRWFDE